ncbi:MAG: hypothetical protein HOV66_07850 [Streptomycetaceae bacterium]|nr:hypothetical protein [Streptomycetaceae bacterium]NUS54762.1 hypothetical protein [Streptomycetaceae bacterium]
MTWRDDVAELFGLGASVARVAVVDRKYRGRHRAQRRVSRAVPRRPLTDQQIDGQALFTVIRHLEDGRTVDDAWDLGIEEARALKLDRAVTR